MSTAYLGEIRVFGFNFAPQGWAMCNGQLLPISQYAALFSILGTAYGGNGTSNFALPNLQGQIPMHWSLGTNAPFQTVLGETMGTPNVTLTQQQMPLHTHTVTIAAPGAEAQRQATPGVTAYMAGSANPNRAYLGPPTTPTINAPFSPSTIGLTGSSVPHDNMQPYLTMTFCIAMQGVFPSRG
jgi:microcystin-dependent protein